MTTVMDSDTTACLGKMPLHQIGQDGGEFLYPATTQRLMRMPQNVHRHGGQAFRLVLSGGHQKNLILCSLLRSHRRAPFLVRFLNELGKLDTDPSRLRLYQEVGMFGGDYFSLSKVHEVLTEALQVHLLPGLL
jgi:hypothetical protein